MNHELWAIYVLFHSLQRDFTPRPFMIHRSRYDIIVHSFTISLDRLNHERFLPQQRKYSKSNEICKQLFFFCI